MAITAALAGSVQRVRMRRASLIDLVWLAEVFIEPHGDAVRQALGHRCRVDHRAGGWRTHCRCRWLAAFDAGKPGEEWREPRTLLPALLEIIRGAMYRTQRFVAERPSTRRLTTVEAGNTRQTSSARTAEPGNGTSATHTVTGVVRGCTTAT